MTSLLITTIYLVLQLLLESTKISCYIFYSSKNHLSKNAFLNSKLLQTPTNSNSKNDVNSAVDIHDGEGYSSKDSFNLIVLGDLHLEEENMKIFEEARSDCVSILKDISLLSCPSPPSSSQSNNNKNKNKNVKSIIESISKKEAGELTIEQLEMLIQRKKQGPLMNCHMVSLGDLGRKEIRHEQGDPGTTKSFTDAKQFFDGFDNMPYEVVTGNHDLEG